MKIYRLEKDNLGPYQHRYCNVIDDAENEVMNELDDAHSFDTEHPTWNNAFCSGYNHNDKSGFASLKDLYDWFEGYLKDLISYGYEITFYWVDEKYVIQSYNGLNQLRFNSTKATQLKGYLV